MLRDPATKRFQYLCHHCFWPTELYMLKDELWRALGYDRFTNVCLTCLRTAVGRPFQREDFRDVAVNKGWLDIAFGPKHENQ